MADRITATEPQSNVSVHRGSGFPFGGGGSVLKSFG
jgi:hypothetical protein